MSHKLRLIQSVIVEDEEESKEIEDDESYDDRYRFH